MVRKAIKKTNKLDRYIITCFIILVAYIIAHTVIFVITGAEATTLTRVVFGLFGFELLCCFLIKRFKLHEEFKIIKGHKNETDDFSVDEMEGEL